MTIFEYEYIKDKEELIKARSERIWIETNPQIHILNYPYYKLKRIFTSFNKD